MKDNLFYLVSYIGIYCGSEGDHNHCLFDSLEKAEEKFAEWKDECIDYYEEERGIYFHAAYDEEDDRFALWTDDNEDHVDIYITPIKVNGETAQMIL